MDLLNDKVRPLFFRYLLSALGSALLNSLFVIADVMMIGQYHGPAGNAAVSVFSPIWTAAYSLGLLAGIGGSVLYSRARGRGETENARGYFSLSLALGGVFSVLAVGIVALFQRPIMRFFGADGEILDLCLRYLQPVLFAVPCIIFTIILAAFLRGDRDPLLASGAVIAGGCLNAVGDYFLVFRLDLGIRGAGIATAAGMGLSLLLMLIHFFLKKNTLRLVQPKASRTGKLLRAGFPAAVCELSMGLLVLIFNRQIRQYLDTDTIAAFGIITGIVIFFQNIAYGIGQAAQPILSENCGAGREDRVRACTRYGLCTGLALGVAAAALLLLAPEMLIRLFTSPTPNLLRIGPGIARTYSLALLLMPLNLFAIYFFQSVMKGTVATAASLARGVVVSGILAFLLPLLFGRQSLFWAAPVTEVLVFGVLLWLLRRENALRS